MTTLAVPPPGQVLRWLGGPVDVRVEVEAGMEGLSFAVWDEGIWDSDLWGSIDLEWIDITEFIFSVDVRAGAERWGERFESASAVLTVDNTSGIWTPEAEVPYFYKELRPGRRIRCVVYPDPTDDASKNVLFMGQIDSLTDAYDDAGHAVTTAIVCTDFISLWASYNPTMLETPTGWQYTNGRISSALDRLGWPNEVGNVDRLIQIGEHTMQSSHLAESTWEECARAADAEGGAFWSDAEGRAHFRARDWLTTDTRCTIVQGYFGYDDYPEGAMVGHIVAVEVSHEAARIVNHVSMARAGGTMQTVEDLDSQSLHGIRTYQRTDLLNLYDSEVAFLAARYLAAYKTDRMRVERVTIAAVEDPDNEGLNSIFWDAQFGDRLAIKVKTAWGWEVELETHLFGIEHRITADDWTMVLTLDDAQTFEAP